MNDQTNLFSTSVQAPLAYKLRPSTLDHYIGQKHLSPYISALNAENPSHIIFHGPPGTGKTTLALILADHLKLKIHSFNAVLGGLKDLRELISQVLDDTQMTGKKAVIFIDEIHRFNKSQQDALLPYLEKGDFVLFGATTEYPKTSLNKAILSRVQTWSLNKLSQADIKDILNQAINKEQINIADDVIDYIAFISSGDARYALGQLEKLINNQDKIKNLSIDQIKESYLSINREFDKNSNRHYDVISAFIKSIRGSDTNAAIVWLAVMIDGGEDPEFIARRLIISASEDIGNADPRALTVATSAHYGIKNIGMPEARLILAQATTYLANAPKSNASYLAINEALNYVKENPTIEVPTHLRNNHPDSKKYKYPHSFDNHYVKQSYCDPKLRFYKSSNIAYEKMQEDYLAKIKKND